MQPRIHIHPDMRARYPCATDILGAYSATRFAARVCPDSVPLARSLLSARPIYQHYVQLADYPDPHALTPATLEPFSYQLVQQCIDRQRMAANYTQVLIGRYLMLCSYDDLALGMHYSDRHIMRLHAAALVHVESTTRRLLRARKLDDLIDRAILAAEPIRPITS